MKEKIPYLRVGTTYYKTIEKPLISGDKISILVRWNRETIISDCGKTYLSQIDLSAMKSSEIITGKQKFIFRLLRTRDLVLPLLRRWLVSASLLER